MSLGEKLRELAELDPRADLISEIDIFTLARNTAAHASSSNITNLSMHDVLRSADSIVSQFAKLASSRKLGATYYLYKDTRGSGAGAWRLQMVESSGIRLRVIEKSRPRLMI
jgi:hypothetical protein